jgi:hypothetical protein
MEQQSTYHGLVILTSDLMTRTRRAFLFVGIASVIATWIAASLQLEDGPLDLLPFTAPGAVFGLWVGWLAHSFSREHFNWSFGLLASGVGAVALPPWLALLVVIGTLNEPGQLILVFTSGAWVALAIGLVASVFVIRRPLGRWTLRLHARREDKCL